MSAEIIGFVSRLDRAWNAHRSRVASATRQMLLELEPKPDWMTGEWIETTVRGMQAPRPKDWPATPAEHEDANL